MSNEKSDVIELPADPFERASEVVAAMKALNEPVRAALSALENVDQALLAAANTMDASRGITIRMGAQMPELSRGLGEIAVDHAAAVSEFRRVRQECYRLTESLQL